MSHEWKMVIWICVALVTGYATAVFHQWWKFRLPKNVDTRVRKALREAINNSKHHQHG